MPRVPASSAPDVLVVSLGTTAGLRRADEALADLMREAGVRVEVVGVKVGVAGSLRRAQPAIDLVEAAAARRATGAALARVHPRAIVFSSVTSAILQPRRTWEEFRTAIRFDSPAAINRPGSRNAPQRALESRAFDRASLLLPWGEAGRAACGGRSAVVLPVPIERRQDVEDAARGGRDSRLAVAYAADPWKRGLDLLLRAWAQAAVPGGRLAVCGIEADRAALYMRRCGGEIPPSVEFPGHLPAGRFAGLVARSKIFVNASRREDYGLSQLEALAAGAMLVTVRSPGCYEALPIAGRLAPDFVAAEPSAGALAAAISAGFGAPDSAAPDYGARARALLSPYGREAVRRTLESEVLPRLLQR